MAENIKLKDLYAVEQTYNGINTVAIPKADGSGDAYYVQRPVINYTLIDPPSHEIVVDGVDSVFVLNAGDGDDLGNIFGNAYGAVSGKTTKPIVAIAIRKYASGIVTNNNGYARILYLYEELPGSVLKEIIGFTGATDFTAGAGWGQLLSDDNKNVTGYSTITDVSSVVIGIEQPGGIVNADIFYSLLSEVTQEEQTVSVTENGEQTIVPTAGKSGIRKVALNVNVAGGGGGVQPDWNQNDSTAADFVKNRPGAFTVPQKDAVTITWDGVIGDKENVDMDGLLLVKVSDEIFYPPNLYGATITSKSGDNELQTVLSQNGYEIIYNFTGITTIGQSFDVLSVASPINMGGLQLSVGTWFQRLSDTIYTKELSTIAGDSPGDPVYVALDGESMVDFGAVSQYGLQMKVGVGSNVNEDIGVAMGTNLVTNTKNGLVVGMNNIPSYSKLFIVGNGNESVRSNAFSVGTDGNIEVGGQEIVIKSSTAGSTKKFKITVDDTGTLNATEVTI